MGRMTRRDLLRLSGSAATVGMLAACGRRHHPPAPTPSASAPIRPTPAPSSPPTPAWDDLAKSLKGPLVRPGSDSYVSAAKLYNPRYDATVRPAAIARCATDTDVVACVRFAAHSGVPFALRSGGHSYPGWSTSTGLVVDVSPMNQVVVDPVAKTARIAAGTSLAKVYSGLAAHGMALAAGSCPTVGIAGLATGGGVGVLTRAYGLTCDAIREVDVVTADGILRQVDSSQDSGLYWALRGGGGGSFGAVTGFTVAVQPAPSVVTFYYEWPMAQAADVLSHWQPWIADADRRLTSSCKLLSRPKDGTQRALVAGAWIGPAKDLSTQLKPLLTKLPKPAQATVHSHTYADAMLLEAGCDSGEDAAQCVASALAPAQRQAFSATSSVLVGALNELAVKTVVDNANAAMNLHSMIEGGLSFDALGGAVLDLDVNATAFAHRDAAAIVQYTATYADDQHPAAYDGYVRSFRTTMGVWMGTAAYVNYADASIVDYPSAYWPATYARLQQVKQQYDPGDLFTFPQSVRAAGGTR